MQRYEVHFKDHGGRVFSVGELQAASDRQAIARARRLFRTGVGAGYEIWRKGVCLHSELLGTAAKLHPKLPRSDGLDAVTHRMHACIREAAATKDHAQQLRLLKETEDCLRQIAEADQLGQDYRLQLRNRHGRLVAQIVIKAEQDDEALKTASVLADSLSAACSRFDLWRGGEWIGWAKAPFRLPDARELGHLAQRIVLQREITQPDTRQGIADSGRPKGKIESSSSATKD
jgi:1,2-phenylacetyl-CoA epoxidase PaaB subunit